MPQHLVGLLRDCWKDLPELSVDDRRHMYDVRGLLESAAELLVLQEYRVAQYEALTGLSRYQVYADIRDILTGTGFLTLDALLEAMWEAKTGHFPAMGGPS